jgi:addiction module HigA family antidote
MRLPKNRTPTHPGEILLEEFIKPLGISQTELAEWIGVSYPRLNEIIHAKRGITPDTALRLQQVFGSEARFWLNLQVAWDLYQAAHSESARAIWRIQRHPALTGSATRVAERPRSAYRKSGRPSK